MLRNALANSLEQILAIVDILKALPASQATYLYREKGVGRHVRHIADHFVALRLGLEAGAIDYNQRSRGTAVELDWEPASIFFGDIAAWLNKLEGVDREIEVFSEIDCWKTVSQSFKSTVARELLYLINHTIHHAAYINLLLHCEGITTPEHIGIAPGTARFLREKTD